MNLSSFLISSFLRRNRIRRSTNSFRSRKPTSGVWYFRQTIRLQRKRPSSRRILSGFRCSARDRRGKMKSRRGRKIYTRNIILKDRSSSHTTARSLRKRVSGICLPLTGSWIRLKRADLYSDRYRLDLKPNCISFGKSFSRSPRSPNGFL